MPRKRTVSDEALLDAALAIVHSSGPDALTFAAVAAPAGLAPSTVVQRFGTKAHLLQAALLRAWDLLDEQTATAASAAPLEPRGVTALLVQLSEQYGAHDYADQLLLLREDLRDPVLRARGQAWLATLTREIDRRLPQAPAPGTGLGELVVACWQGTLTFWSFTQAAPVTTMVRAALDDLLDRLLNAPSPTPGASGT